MVLVSTRIAIATTNKTTQPLSLSLPYGKVLSQ